MRGILTTPRRTAVTVTALALLAALAGTAIAGPNASTSVGTSQVKKISQKQAKKQIEKLAPTLSVANATTATSATSAANASTVGGKSASQLQSVGRSEVNGSCDPPSGFVFVSCATVSVNLPSAGRVLLVGDLTWYSDTASPTRAVCRLTVDGASGSPWPDAIIGELLDVTDADHMIGQGLTGVTGVLGAGSHTFRIRCAEGQGDIVFDAAYLSAVSLGSA